MEAEFHKHVDELGAEYLRGVNDAIVKYTDEFHQKHSLDESKERFGLMLVSTYASKERQLATVTGVGRVNSVPAADLYLRAIEELATLFDKNELAILALVNLMKAKVGSEDEGPVKH